MSADDLPVPPGYRAVSCLRCRHVMVVHDDVWEDPAARHQAMVEHHAWLCINPTRAVASARAVARGRRRQWP